MGTVALNSGLWVRRLLNSCGDGCANVESTFQEQCPASEVNDRGCPEKPDNLTMSRLNKGALRFELGLQGRKDSLAQIELLKQVAVFFQKEGLGFAMPPNPIQVIQ